MSPIEDPLADTLAHPSEGVSGSPRAPTEVDWSSERYLPMERLGEGGMGVVERLRDRRIGRDVAQKRVKSGDVSSNAEVTARFLHEACVQGRLEHPSVVPVYDLGREGDSPFFTMKVVEGETLADILEKLGKRDASMAARFPRRRLLTAFTQVALSVHYAHARGVVHRDLKPANVMLGRFGEVYVLDWGLAKTGSAASAPPAGSALEPRIESSGSGRTEVGAILGTLGYMSPEQLRDASTVDARSDVYALGAMLFEILALEPLHARTNAAQMIADTLTSVEVETRLAGRDVPPELSAIVERATVIEAAGRTATAGELAEAVERFLDGDRDLERRRELSREHLEAAQEQAKLAAEAPDGKDALAARRRALAEVGRALALDPRSGDAMRTLVALIEAPPKEVPDEVRARITKNEQRARGAGASRGVFGFLSAAVLLPLALNMGVRSWTELVVLCAAFTSAAVMAMRGARQADERDLPMFVPLLGLLVLCAASTIGGALLIVPSMAATFATPWVMLSSKPRRALAISACCLGVLLPLAAGGLGLVPFPYVARGELLCITPQMLELPVLGSTILFAATSIFTILVNGVLASGLRDEIAKSAAQTEVLAWQLRQLVPGDDAPQAR